MKIKLLTASSDSFMEMNDITMPSKVDWCKHWKINFEFKKHEEGWNCWNRVEFWIDTLPTCDYMIFMGADVMIMDQLKSPNDLIAPMISQNADLTIGWDSSYNGVNCDVFILKNTRSSMNWLKATLMEADKGCQNEQLAMMKYFHLLKTNIVPQRYFNSYDEHKYGSDEQQATDQFQPGDFAVHFSGMGMPRRLELARIRNEQIIKPSPPKKLILRCMLSPGDVLTMTAALRDLHTSFPGKYATDVRTSSPGLWENNPYLTQIEDHDPEAWTFDMEYPLIQECNKPYHFIHGYRKFLESKLGITIPQGAFKGDIHLSGEEVGWAPQVEGRFWIIVSGGKTDFTCKWWDPQRYQEVVDHFAGRIQFVQIGEDGHNHPPLENVINLVGQTDTRQLARLMYHADGVVCPVTFPMHLAAAVDTKPDRPRIRPAVVVAGGREPAHWEQYPNHQFLHTMGMLSCCDNGGCWRSRVQPIGDGDDKDVYNLCDKPTTLPSGKVIPKCMEMITSADVIRSIEGFLQFDKEKK